MPSKKAQARTSTRQSPKDRAAALKAAAPKRSLPAAALVPADGAAADYGGLPDPALVTASFDVEALSLHRMLMLHHAAHLFCGVGEAVLCQPRCGEYRDGGTVEQTEIGHFVEWLVEVCSSVIGRARAEAERRTPANWVEVGFRLQTLAEAVASNDDPAQMRAFARDLQAEAGRIDRG